MSYLRSGRRFSYSHSKKTWQWLGGVALVFFMCLPLFSQTSQGTIQGGVFDQTGGAVAGATVSVIDVARGITRALTTDGAGQYVATNLTPGTYTMKAETKGFQTVEHSGVLVEVGQNIRVDLVLQPGEQTQTITVTGEVPAINTTDATLGGTVSNDAINSLPLNGRNFDRLLQLRPGVVTSIGGGNGNGPQTNGRRNQSDMQRVEGIAGMAQAQGSDILNGTYVSGDSDSLMPIDAIQEFNTEQNPKAEYGFRDGAVVNVGVKSGTNSIHGTAYAFGRDAEATDAANFFTSTVTPGTLQQFGATAGGPILKDKLFWFAGYEGLRVTVGDVSVNTIPADISMSPTNTAFSIVDACNAIGRANVNPLSAQIAGLPSGSCTPQPASSTFENLFPFTTNTNTKGNFVAPLTSNSPLNNGLIKGDYVPGPHHHLNGMYFVSKSSGLFNSLAQQLAPQWEALVVNNVQQYDGSWTWTPNSTWVNDFRMGYVYLNNSRGFADQNVVASNPWPTGYGMNTGVTNPLYGGLPQIQIQSFTGFLGGGNRSSIRGPEGDVDVVESVSHLRGKHTFKFGFEYVDAILDGNTYSQAQGNIVFSTLTTFLQGTPNSGTILLGDPTEQARSHWYAGYFQDDWRATSKLTLNLGLRYEYIGAPVVRNNYFGNFNPNVDPATTPAIQQFGPGAPLSAEYDAEHKDISPRLGVAWDVRGNGKTVVRTGAGVYRNPSIMKPLIEVVPFGATFFGANGLIGPNMSGTDANAHTASQPNCAGAGCATVLNWNTTGATIFPSTASQKIGGVTYTGATCTVAAPCNTAAVDPHLLDAYSVQWNLDIQRALTNNLTLDVAYVGNHGYDEVAQVDANQPPLGTGWAGTPTTNCLNSAPLYNNCKGVSAAQELAAQPYGSKFPYLKNITEITNGQFSNYNALQTTFQARGYHGLSFLAGYTYSHALSESDGNATGTSSVVTDKNNLRLNYGNSGADLRHRFTFSPTYLIPGMKSPGQMLEGWSLSAILALQSGGTWNPSDPGRTIDYLGTGDVGTGVTQYWNLSGPPSAFTASNTAVPCFTALSSAGSPVLSGCTPYSTATVNGVPNVPQPPASCVTAAEAPYAGNPTQQGLALAALTNGGCYVKNGGILTPPAFGTVGDAYNGIFRGQTYKNVDMSVSKLWKFRERYSAQLRIEFFNLLNRADFAGPGAGSGTGPAGTNPASGINGGFGYDTLTPDASNPVLGSGGPRHIQFGLKLTY
jgi:hypothetical protein